MSAVRRWENFDYDESDGVATVTFSRPERLNSLTFEVYADIRDLTDSLRARQEEIRVLVIRGRGRGFCSGGDVDQIARDTERDYHMSGDEACAYGLIDRVVRQHEVTPRATGKSNGGGQRG